jgi:hypothetical protein
LATTPLALVSPLPANWQRNGQMALQTPLTEDEYHTWPAKRQGCIVCEEEVINMSLLCLTHSELLHSDKSDPFVNVRIPNFIAWVNEQRNLPCIRCAECNAKLPESDYLCTDCRKRHGLLEPVPL